MTTCRKLQCKIFGHKWMTFNYYNQETAVCRICHVEVIGGTPARYDLYCTRSGEWIEVDHKKIKNYLTKYPFAEEEEKPQEGGFIVVERAD